MHKTSRKSLQDASGVGVVLATKRQNAAGASCAFCQAASSLVTAKRRVEKQDEGVVCLLCGCQMSRFSGSICHRVAAAIQLKTPVGNAEKKGLT